MKLTIQIFIVASLLIGSWSSICHAETDEEFEARWEKRYDDPFEKDKDNRYDYYKDKKADKDDRYIDTQKKSKTLQLDTWGQSKPMSSEEVLRHQMSPR